jgi:hypothetical protein
MDLADSARSESAAFARSPKNATEAQQKHNAM